MKKLIFALLLLPSLAWAGEMEIARMNPYILGSSVPAACGDLMTERTDGTSNQVVSYDTNTAKKLYQASTFTATASGDIRTVYIDIKDGGDPAGYLYMYACADNSGSPVAIGSCVQSTTTNITDPGGTYVQKKYSFAEGAFTVSASSTYWLVVTNSAGLDSTNFFYVECNSVVTGQKQQESGDGTTWSSIDSSAQWNMKITSCVE